jgi:F-type H+-transporting ATPase subunit delta
VSSNDAPAPKRDSSSGPVLNLRFATSSELLVHRPVYMVTVPAASGVMGVLGDHAPTIAQLKPGIVTVHTNDMADITHRYFISGGFAVIKADSSAVVTAVEAIKPEDLDAGAARKALDEAQAALLKASSDREKAEAQIAIELNEAVLQAIETKA